MITKGELRKIAERKSLSLENAEKDYLLDILLFQIATESGDALILKGGASLYKFFNLNRFSEDLDFTLNRRRFDEEAFVKKIIRRLALIGIDGKVKDTEKSGNEINVKFHFRGPLYDGSQHSLCYIAVNISRRERIIKEPKRELVIPSSREIPSFQAYVMDEGEIAAEKVRAIMTRNKPRDVYDLWFLLKRGVILDLSMVDTKLNIYSVKFSLDKFKRSVEEKRKSWDTDLKGLVMGDLVGFSRAKEEILAKIGND